jgi:hypothetical protein
MLVALALLTSTSDALATHQCPPGVPKEQASDLVAGLAAEAQGMPPGTLNLRFVFDPSAPPKERLMWQTLVVQHFFASHAVRIRVELDSDETKHRWIGATDVKKIIKALREALKDGTDVAIFMIPDSKGEYRLAPVV